MGEINITENYTNSTIYKFSEIFDLSEVQKLQDSFSAATGVASIITEPDGTPITEPSGFCSLCNEVIRKTEKGLKNCLLSDSIIGSPKNDGPTIQKCLSSGMIDGGASIIVKGRHIANWLIGQVLDEDCKIEDLLSYAEVIGVKQEIYREELLKVNQMSRQQFENVSKFLFLNVQQLSKYAVRNIYLTNEINKKIHNEAEKKAEQTLKNLNETLKQQVRDRTSQLEEANEVLEGFSYSVSHDLRAPLRHIMGFVELLNKHSTKTLDEKSKHYLSVISDSAKRMGVLIDKLLSFSRMGKVEMLNSRIDIRILLKEVIDTMTQDTAGRIIEWNICELPVVKGDITMLSLALSNLIANALKFTRSKPLTKIEIGSYTDLKNPDDVVFYVKDNGVGFDMQNKNKLFEICQRLHRQEDFEGTGIGLAIVQQIILRHGGRTWAEGIINEGATFYFTLSKYKEDNF